MSKMDMTLGIDVDGVLCDQIGNCLQYINRFYNLKVEKEDVVEWDYFKNKLGIGNKELLDCMALSWHKFYELPMLEVGIPSMIHDLRKKGHKIIIISHRTRSTFPFVCLWLDLNKIEYDALVFVTSSESKANYPIDCLIDDSPLTVKDFTDSHKRLYLRTQPWNSSITDLPSNVTRVSNFSEFYYKIMH